MLLLFLSIAYCIGSLSFAILVSRLFRLDDPRSYGSKNPGATNVLRTGNKLAAFLTLFCDCAKGWLAVWLAQHSGYQWNSLEIALIGLAVFAGHLWPIFFRFKGGKGVATALGVLIAINPWMGLTIGAVWLVVMLLFRYSSLAAIVAAVCTPFYYGLLVHRDPSVWVIVLICLLLLYRHKNNFRKLLTGTETKIGRAR